MRKYGTTGQATDGNIIRRMRIACRVNRTTYMHSEHVIIVASQRQQGLSERTPLLRYKYIPSVVLFQFIILLLTT